MNRFGSMLLCSVMAGLVGCSSGSSLDLQFVSGAESAARVNAYAPQALVIDRLELQVREVKALPDDASDGDEYKADGIFTLDLLDSANNTISFPDAEPVVYKKVEFKVDKPSAGEGIDGGDYSLVYEGEQDGILFRYVDDQMDKVTVRNEDGANLADGGSATLYINLDVASWLSNIDLSVLEVDDAGVVVLDPDGANQDAHQTVENNVKSAIKLAREP